MLKKKFRKKTVYLYNFYAKRGRKNIHKKCPTEINHKGREWRWKNEEQGQQKGNGNRANTDQLHQQRPSSAVGERHT